MTIYVGIIATTYLLMRNLVEKSLELDNFLFEFQDRWNQIEELTKDSISRMEDIKDTIDDQIEQGMTHTKTY